MKLCLTQQTVLFKLLSEKADGELSAVNGNVHLFEQVRNSADMVFVAVRNKKTFDFSSFLTK